MPPPLGRKELRWARAAAVRRARRGDSGPTSSSSATTTSAAKGSAPRPGVGARGGARSECPGDRLSGIARSSSSIARCSSSRCAAGASGICARADLIVTPSAAILPAGTPAAKIVELEWGADTDASVPDVAGAVPFARPAETVAVFAGAFRSWHGADAPRDRARGSCASAADATSARCSSATVPSCRACARRRAASAACIVHRARCRTIACRPASPRATSASRRSTSAAHAPLALGFYWSPLKIFEYMAAGPPGRRPRGRADPDPCRAPSAKGSCTQPSEPGALAAALERAGRSGRCGSSSERPRGSAPSASTAGRRTARRSSAAMAATCTRPATRQPRMRS